jgi:hypothetical protein
MAVNGTNGRGPSFGSSLGSLVNVGPVLPFGQVGVTGLDHTSGFVREEFVRELQGENWRRVAREMSEQDSTVGAVLTAIELLCRRVSWDMVPANESNEAQRWAGFFQGAMFADMSYSWEDTLAEILSMLTWGWSYLEIVYKKRSGDDPGGDLARSRFDDGLIGWKKWEIRSQDTLYGWEYAPDDTFIGMVQQAPPRYERTLIPIEKSLHFKTTSRKGNPEGVSILRKAYLSWYYKKNIARIEAIGIERDLAGLPVAYAPRELFGANVSPEAQAVRAELLQLVTNIRRDSAEGVLFPLVYDQNGHQLYDLKLLSSGGSRQFDTTAVIQRYDQSIATTMLADFILLGQNAVGSYALASSKTSIFATAIGTYLDSIQSVINTFAIPRLAKLNRIPQELWPSVQHGDIETVDLDALGGYISQLAGAGANVFENPKVLPYLLEQAGIPVPGEVEEQVTGVNEPTDEELDGLNAIEDAGTAQ